MFDASAQYVDATALERLWLMMLTRGCEKYIWHMISGPTFTCSTVAEFLASIQLLEIECTFAIKISNKNYSWIDCQIVE